MCHRPTCIARLHSLTILVARRLCDPAGMGPEDRCQPLEGAVIEYVVHGYFYWRESDTNGTYGAWWVPLRKMVRQLGKEYVEGQLQVFEQEMHSLKADAITHLSKDILGFCLQLYPRIISAQAHMYWPRLTDVWYAYAFNTELHYDADSRCDGS